MAGEKGKVQTASDPGVVPGAAGADTGTEGQDTSPEARLQQLSALEQEVVSLKARTEKDQGLIRSLQSAKDTEVARERKQWEAREKALRSFVKDRIEGVGATPEEVTQFEEGYTGFADGLSAQEKARRYDEMLATTAAESEVQEAQQEMVKGIAEEFGVEIPPDHKDLKKDDPITLSRSATRLAKKLVDEKAKQEEKDELTKAAGVGALGALGTGPGGTANPLAGITDPTQLLKMGYKKKKK